MCTHVGQSCVVKTEHDMAKGDRRKTESPRHAPYKSPYRAAAKLQYAAVETDAPAEHQSNRTERQA
jgi:hypothetical protein